MDLNTIALIATAYASACLGIVAYLRAPDRPSNRIFALHTSGVTVWALVTCAIELTEDIVILKSLLKLVHVVSAFCVVTLVDFIWVFPNRLRPSPLSHRLLLYLSGALFGAVACLPPLVRSIEHTPHGLSVQFGWPLAVFGIYVVPVLCHANILLWRKAKTLSGVAKVQTIYVLTGTLASELVILWTNVFLPMITGTTAFSRWGVVAYLLTVAAIAIAIAKHRLWDLSSLARRTAAAVLSVSSLGLFAALVIRFLGPWIVLPQASPVYAGALWTVFGALLGALLIPVYNAFRGLVSQLLQEEHVRISKLLNALGEAIVHAPFAASPGKSWGELALLPILEDTQRFFGASFVEVYLRNATGAYSRLARVGSADLEVDTATCVEEAYSDISGPASPPEAQPPTPDVLSQEVVQNLRADELTEPLEIGQLVRFETMEQALRKLRAMDAIRASVVVPLLWSRASSNNGKTPLSASFLSRSSGRDTAAQQGSDNETIGLLVLGPKLSRDMYTPSEIDLLKSVAAHAAIAVKNAELRAQIMLEKERTDKVLAQMESAVIVADTSGIIRLVNPAAHFLLSATATQTSSTLPPTSSLVGQPIEVLPTALQAPLRTALETGQTVSGNKIFLTKGEEAFRVDCSTLCLQGPDGKREGAGMVLRDLRMEDALRRAEQEAERLKFIRAVSAGMAHEIRNPLVAIRTFAELAPIMLNDPEFRESFLEVALKEVARIEGLVSQFMALAKPARIVQDPIDIRELVDSAVKTVSARAQAEQIKITVNIPEDLPKPRGDATRLHQALLNLLLNALDATLVRGQVEVRADFDPGKNGSMSEVSITVWNSGSYIPPEDRERVFEPFFTSKVKGAGLGLAICNTIVDEHGGRITVQSDKENGTSFTIRLPVPLSHETTATTTS